jgi:hypothetical protein
MTFPATTCRPYATTTGLYSDAVRMSVFIVLTAIVITKAVILRPVLSEAEGSAATRDLLFILTPDFPLDFARGPEPVEGRLLTPHG